MGALIWRELVAITRTPAYWVSAAAYVVVLATFVIVWGDGIPVVGARSNWEQFVAAQRVLLAMLLPWVAARCGVSSRRELIVLGFITGRSPLQCLSAKSIALTAALLGVALSAVPVITLMAQIAAAGPFVVLSSVAPLAVLAVSVAVVTTAIAVMLEDPLRIWVASSVLMLVSAGGRLPAGTGLSMILAIAVAAALYLFAVRSRLIYLPERNP